jgi:cytochrome P450
VFTLRMMIGGPFVMIAEPEYLRAIWKQDREHRLNEGRRFLLEPVLGRRSVLLQVGDEHLRRRKLMLPPFHGDRMRSYARVMEEMTLRDIERWPVGRPFPLQSRTQRITMDVILRAVFGTSGGEREEELRRRLTALLGRSNEPRMQLWVTLDWFTGQRVRPFQDVVEPVDDVLYAEIADRRAAEDLEEREDILSMLMLARDENGESLSDQELRDQLITLLVAGHETTATGLAWTFDALFRHPAAMQRLKDDPDDEKYLGAVVDEALRIRPVVPEVGRRLGVPVELNGWTLPAGIDVFASVQLAHRRADLFPDPLAFRPERFLDGAPEPYTFIPFGGGTRRCLGAAFATLELREVVRAVARRFDLRPDRGEGERMRRRSITLTPARGGYVIPEPLASPAARHADVLSSQPPDRELPDLQSRAAG